VSAPRFNIPPLDLAAQSAARVRQDSLTKPRGSLGVLEDVACRMAAIQGTARPAVRWKWVVVAAGDHGVVAEGVSPYPQEVTAQMAANFLRGGAAISVLARHAGAGVVIIDAGIAHPVPAASVARADGRLAQEGPVLFRSASAGRGTSNMATGPAMSAAQACALIEAGRALAHELSVGDASVIATGDMGIGNTTAAAAITSVFTRRPPVEVTGRGTGLDDAGLRRKVTVIERAIAVNRPDASDPVGVVSGVGGFEIAFLAGLMLGAAERRIAIALDGFISTSAALVAQGLNPRVTHYTFACHMSAEPGHRAALEHLGLRPLLDLGMRLGEGTGATLGLQVIEAAVKLHNEMATFEEAAVSNRPDALTAPPTPVAGASPPLSEAGARNKGGRSVRKGATRRGKAR
jgi:nicotinate-nucleotide--dimethylbenzimidazole phosphoribosyltransferase